MLSTAKVTQFEIRFHRASNWEPTVVTAVRMITAINELNRAYSIAVTPSSEKIKSARIIARMVYPIPVIKMFLAELDAKNIF